MLAEKENRNNLHIIDDYKAIMMLCVVLYHSACLWQENWAPMPMNGSTDFLRFISVLTSVLNSFHIYGFVFASGYLFYYLRYEQNRYRNGWKDLKRRSVQLLVPYGCMSILWCIPIYSMEFGFDFRMIAKKYILGTSPSQLWFLLMLFTVFVVFYYTSDYIERIQSYFVFGALYLVSIFASYLMSVTGLVNCFQIGNACKFLLFFYLGYIWRKKAIQPHNWLVIVCACVNICYCTYTAMHEIPIVLRRILMPAISICGVISSFGIVGIMEKRMRVNVVLTRLKKYCMPVYLLHQQIIYGLSHVMSDSTVPEAISLLIVFILAIAVSILISFAVCQLQIGRIILGVTRFDNRENRKST